MKNFHWNNDNILIICMTLAAVIFCITFMVGNKFYMDGMQAAEKFCIESNHHWVHFEIGTMQGFDCLDK